MSVKKKPLFLTLLSLTLLLGIFFLPPKEILAGIFRGTFSGGTLNLVLLIWITVSFTALIDEGRTIEQASLILNGSSASPAFILPVFPAIIGLFPMPGGALVSAPMLEKLAEDKKIAPESKAVVNFWFRHLWEPIWPLYPGIILMMGYFDLSVGQVFAKQFFLTLLSIAGGIAFLLLPQAKNLPAKKGNGPFPLLRLLGELWPVILLVAGVLLIPSGPLYLSILLILISVMYSVLKKLEMKKIYNAMKRGFSLKLLALIPIIFIFKYYVEHSGLKEAIEAVITGSNFPLDLVIFTVPFIFGMLFGLTIAFISMSVPLLMSFLVPEPGSVNTYYTTLLFLGGYAGILFSPMHLCLLLSKEYFKASLFKIYLKMLAPGAVLIAAGYLLNVLLNK